MYERLARKLAQYEYFRSCAVAEHDVFGVDRWTYKYYGFCNAVEIATGHWPIAISEKGNVVVYIGDYKAVVAFD